jgi:hypothetical protein
VVEARGSAGTQVGTLLKGQSYPTLCSHVYHAHLHRDSWLLELFGRNTYARRRAVRVRVVVAPRKGGGKVGPFPFPQQPHAPFAGRERELCAPSRGSRLLCSSIPARRKWNDMLLWQERATATSEIGAAAAPAHVGSGTKTRLEKDVSGFAALSLVPHTLAQARARRAVSRAATRASSRDALQPCAQRSCCDGR